MAVFALEDTAVLGDNMTWLVSSVTLQYCHKVGKNKEETNISTLINNTLEQDALNALITLGIARPAAEQAIKKVKNEVSGTDKVEDIIKKALKIL